MAPRAALPPPRRPEDSPASAPSGDAQAHRSFLACRENETRTNARDTNDRSQARQLHDRPGRHRGAAHQALRPGRRAKDAFPGLIDVQLAKIDDQTWIDVWRWDSLANAQAAAQGPTIAEAGAAFSLTKSVAVEYAEILDA